MSQKGFTFVEMLLVLTVVTVLTCTILPLGDKWIREKSDEDALQALIACIYNAQAYSMAHNVGTNVVIKNSVEGFVASAGVLNICSGTFPRGMHISTRSNMHSVKFLKNGNIYPSGVLTLNTNTGIKELRFQLVRGRVIVYD